MIDYNDLKELLKRVDDFDQRWLSTRGIFTQMHKAGFLEKDDYEAIITEYDKVMAPINSARDKAENYVVDKLLKLGLDLFKGK
jgi:hypothetical protein